MKWTTDIPNLQTAKHGEFYWFIGTLGTYPNEVVAYDSPTIVELHSTNGQQLFAKRIYANWWIDVATSKGKWAGPLELPTD
jgi:hypothetical protein